MQRVKQRAGAGTTGWIVPSMRVVGAGHGGIQVQAGHEDSGAAGGQARRLSGVRPMPRGTVAISLGP